MGLWLLLFGFMGAGGGVVEDEVSPTDSTLGHPNLLSYSHPLNFDES